MSTVKSEYVQHLTHCQENAQERLRNAHNTIQSLQQSLHAQEQVQSVLNERIRSMQSTLENNDRQMRYEIRQMQNSHEQQLKQAQEKEALTAQELNLQFRVAENIMDSTISSSRVHLEES